MSTSEPGPPPSANPEEPFPCLRVLCVDDNHDVADSTALLLRAVGFEALACYDGHDALQTAETFRPSVCLLDLNMPGMCGDELAVRLRARATWQPLLLVAVTAMSNEESRQRIVEAGFHLHLVKPISLHQLRDVVDALFLLAETGAKSAARSAECEVRELS